MRCILLQTAPLRNQCITVAKKAQGLDAGMRLTVDGAQVINLVGKFNGEDSNGNAMAVVNIPPITARSNILIEAFNDSTVSRDYGWNALYRPM